MAALTLRHALAAPFTTTSHTFAVDLNTGASTHTVTYPAITDQYVLLGTSTTDALQRLQTAMNAPAPALPGGVSFAVAMSASGKVVITCTGDTFKYGASLPSAEIGKTLGFTASVASFVASVTADQQPKYLALFVEMQGLVWQPLGQNAYAESAGAVSYGYQSSVLMWAARDVRFGFVPRDPSYTDTNTTQTPWHPADAMLSTLGTHAVPWGVSDVLRVSGGKTLHLAHQNLQTLLTSTTAVYYNVCLIGADLAAARIERQTGAWDKYLRWTATLLRQTTPTGTRA